MNGDSKKAKIFLSYAHTDADKMKEFNKYLSVMKLTGNVEIWTDGALEAGTEWDENIKAELEAADIVLVLVTINAIVSTYIRNVEMKRAYEKYKEGSARVICVIMEECPWENVPTGVAKADGTEYLLKNFQAVKPGGKAIYDPAQPSLANAMTIAQRTIETSVTSFMKSR